MIESIEHHINGQVVAGNSGQLADIYNPALGRVVAKVSLANDDEVNQAVAAAKQAFSTWSTTSAIKRSRVLFRFKALLEQHLDDLAAKLSEHHGKVLDDARGEVLRGIEVVEMVCATPSLIRGSYSENVASGLDCYTIRQALGVCAGITPFNFPVMISIWQSAAAIATGNTFVLKPSEKNPATPMMLAELWREAGLPDGVFNVVNGDRRAVEVLLHHPDVASVVCVGSTAVAETVYKTATANNKRSQTFGGAKNHAIVMPDADLDMTANAILGAAFGAAGERCMALPVVVTIGDYVADELIKRLKPMMSSLKIGPWDQVDVDMGPLISREHLDRVLSYVQQGISAGAKLVYDGRQVIVPGYESGFFMGPCLFDHVSKDMSIYRDEIFGPVLCVYRAKNIDEAMAMINQHEYGNGTAIFTRDGAAARNFASQVQVGMVGINVPIPVPIAFHSFGGWKRSVFGDLRMHGDESFLYYTKAKSVTVKWPEQTSHSESMVMPTH